jgi:hypothetical protein
LNLSERTLHFSHQPHDPAAAGERLAGLTSPAAARSARLEGGRRQAVMVSAQQRELLGCLTGIAAAGA